MASHSSGYWTPRFDWRITLNIGDLGQRRAAAEDHEGSGNHHVSGSSLLGAPETGVTSQSGSASGVSGSVPAVLLAIDPIFPVAAAAGANRNDAPRSEDAPPTVLPQILPRFISDVAISNAADTEAPSVVRDRLETGSKRLSIGGAVRGATAAFTHIFNVIPFADSSETDQNSEPSIAINPLNPNQIVIGAFGNINSQANVPTPFYLSLDGGHTWTDYDNLDTVDKTLGWLADGSGFLTSTLVLRGQLSFTDIHTFAGTISSAGFGSEINIFRPQTADSLDQPWLRTGPSNHVYVGYNNLNFATQIIDDESSGALATANGGTASVNVSTDGGINFTPIVIDRVGAAAGQDAPSVRLAVNGSTVYAVFTRWNTEIESDNGQLRFASDIVVVRSDNGGADAFGALGTGGVGTVVANPITSFANALNNPLTLGQERDGSDIAIAVDPNNANHVVIAYQNTPGADHSGVVQLIVADSIDGGVTWATKFTTSAATRSGQPALAIQTDGTIGFLYDNYDPVTNTLSQHLLQTDDGFATVEDLVLAAESNATPSAVFSPYLGDFFDLTAIGNTFYGVFSASNADNGTDAQFINVDWQRNFTGTPGTADFQLTDSNGNPVAASIDPFFFIAGTPCFARGTLIRTDTGEKRVEELAIGDRLLTADGGPQPIRWIGWRAYDGRFVAGNRNVLPIRVKAGALAEGVPVRDLWVSPEHALYIHGVLIVARHLVNGATITQAEHVDRLEYFNIEFDAQEVIFAEGAPAESYVDCDNRLMFANAPEYAALYPDDERPRWQFCAPRPERDTPEVTAIRAALLERAGALGYGITTEPDLHLLVDGQIARPQSAVGGMYEFAVPAGAGSVSIISRHAVPAETEPAGRDIRRLGVAVERIMLSDGHLAMEIRHSHPALDQGFHEAEPTHRWTDGQARLPEALLRPFESGCSLRVQLADTALAYRIGPEARSGAAAVA